MNSSAELKMLRDGLAQLKLDLLGVKVQLKLRKWIVSVKDGFDPDQPRDEFGMWSDGGGFATPASREFAMGRGNTAECDLQYNRDKLICNLVKTPLCWAQAMERYSACLSGRQIPLLRF